MPRPKTPRAQGTVRRFRNRRGCRCCAATKCVNTHTLQPPVSTMTVIAALSHCQEQRSKRAASCWQAQRRQRVRFVAVGSSFAKGWSGSAPTKHSNEGSTAESMPDVISSSAAPHLVTQKPEVSSVNISRESVCRGKSVQGLAEVPSCSCCMLVHLLEMLKTFLTTLHGVSAA